MVVYRQCIVRHSQTGLLEITNSKREVNSLLSYIFINTYTLFKIDLTELNII